MLRALLTSRCLVLLCSYALALSARAQATALTIVDALDRGDYIVIPPAALLPDVVGIVQQYKYAHKAVNGDIPLEFSWFSICTDGSYRVTVTPEQIYFTDGHENPNRNHLYWAMAITKGQYSTIKQAFIRHSPSGFLNLSKEYEGALLAYKSKSSDLVSDIPAGWSDKHYADYCLTERKAQLAAIFKLLNTALAPTRTVLKQPQHDTPKLISYDKQEILDWLPQLPEKSQD